MRKLNICRLKIHELNNCRQNMDTLLNVNLKYAELRTIPSCRVDLYIELRHIGNFQAAAWPPQPFPAISENMNTK